MLNNKRIIYFFAVIKFIIPFVLIHSSFQLHRDEYLYLADAKHLAWGYLEMPPALALLGYASNLFTGSFYAVYVWTALFGALTLIVAGKIILELKGNVYAVVIGCLAFLTSAFLRINILFQPNFLDAFFWTLSCFYIIRLIHSNNKKYLYYLALCFALGFLSKYTIAFFILGFLCSVIFTPLRKWLLSKHFYLSMLLALLIVSPNIFWQYKHHFPVLHHMQLLQKYQLQYNSRIDFLLNQLLMFASSFYVWILGLWFLTINKTGRKYIAIAVIYFVVIGLLLWKNGKFYYAASLYPALLSAGSVYMERLLSSNKIKIIRWAIPVCMLLFAPLSLPITVPCFSPEKLEAFYKKIHAEKIGVLAWEERKNNPLPQDFADMLGWKEMAEKTAKVYRSLPDSVQQKTMVYGDNYGEAGALLFYRKKLGLPEIYSDDASFAFWLPDKFNYQYFLFVAHDMPAANDDFFNHFSKVEIKDSVTDKYAREFGAKIILYSFPDSTGKSIAERNTKELKTAYNVK
ncbi:MAG: glycosyltransferase family 39 protein [Chitinophagaceae bacterium]|jgi:hypothetical protein|nr:glycosyltransferase family 39 protein [Chitinophagaceae bacterium]